MTRLALPALAASLMFGCQPAVPAPPTSPATAKIVHAVKHMGESMEKMVKVLAGNQATKAIEAMKFLVVAWWGVRK